MFWCTGVENLNICAASTLPLFSLCLIIFASLYILIIIMSTRLSLYLTAYNYQCLVHIWSRRWNLFCVADRLKTSSIPDLELS